METLSERRRRWMRGSGRDERPSLLLLKVDIDDAVRARRGLDGIVESVVELLVEWSMRGGTSDGRGGDAER